MAKGFEVGLGPLATCSLKGVAFLRRLADVARLAANAESTEAIVGGVRLRFSPGQESVRLIAEFLAIERACCPTYMYEERVGEDGSPVLEITGPAGSERALRLLYSKIRVLHDRSKARPANGRESAALPIVSADDDDA